MITWTDINWVVSQSFNNWWPRSPPFHGTNGLPWLPSPETFRVNGSDRQLPRIDNEYGDPIDESVNGNFEPSNRQSSVLANHRIGRDHLGNGSQQWTLSAANPVHSREQISQTSSQVTYHISGNDMVPDNNDHD